MTQHSPEAAPRQPSIDHDEDMPFVIVVDCVANPADHDGLLPFAQVLEEIKVALEAREGMTPLLAHVAIRENRDEIIHAVEAAADEEVRRRGN